MKYLPLLWAGLWRNRTRTAFTFLSILVAFILFGMLQGVNSAFSNAIQGANVNRLYVASNISMIEPLPMSYLQRLEGVEGVTGVAYASWFGGYYQDPTKLIFSFAADVERYFALFPELILPPDQMQAMTTTRTGAVIGSELARRYGWKIGDRVPLTSAIWPQAGGTNDWAFDVVGIFEHATDPGQTQFFFLNADYFDESRAFGKGSVGWYVLRIGDPAAASRIGDAVDALFANSPNETKTQTEKENTQSYLKQVGDINFIVTAIVGAVLFTLLFLTGNTMMQSFRERVPELAVLKTLGFSDGGVVTLMLAESVILCVVAALIGLGVAAAMFPALSAFIGVAKMPGDVVVLGAAIATALAVVAALPPAILASRLTIINALRR